MEEYIENICDLLQIDVPEIEYRDKLLTETMLAMCDGQKIILKKKKPSLDLYFSVAHELRHLWQIKTNEEYYFANYKPINETDLETYNLQPAEVDANAFGFIIMQDAFGVKPLYNELSETVKSAIMDRKAKILEEEFNIK